MGIGGANQHSMGLMKPKEAATRQESTRTRGAALVRQLRARKNGPVCVLLTAALSQEC